MPLVLIIIPITFGIGITGTALYKLWKRKRDANNISQYSKLPTYDDLWD